MRDITELRKLLESPETRATVVHAAMRKLFGEDVYDWDLVTLSMELNEHGIEVDSSVLEKWAAIQTIMTTDAFFKRLDAFIAIANTLSMGDPFFTMFDPATTEEVAWALIEVALNRDVLPFSPAIKDYVRLLLDEDGLEVSMPELFETVFDDDLDHKHVRTTTRKLYKSPNEDVISAYVLEQLEDVKTQLARVDGFNTLSAGLFHSNKGLLDFM